MGWFSKKNKQEDAIAKADRVMNKGLTGLMMKGFVPKQHREAINQSLDSAKQAQLAATGSLPLTATATVLTITDTGKLINFDPIVVLVLDVTETSGRQYQRTLETLVSKMQIPRVGDRVGLGQNPANPSELIYMGLLTG
ncbi:MULTISPECIES: hypothetical protein [Paenibacillus]|uniref:hypothetical protein n=1 Tax=Paenibacillus TaxID=44249 RepID=UPI000BA693ED|nr:MULTISPECIES: hypothetical protein [Paenibacillus]MBE7683565.1 hypothetical protein [Paenibacillus sp. P13VS]MCM3206291.1 hypothetical protein [Paenibacillus illinoisensis]PAF30343.1 hypothetical protein CHI14_16395 [Paenibacillus sp. 7516]WJH28097.1 hypothetical protein N6H13_23850 [Paenibacillus sp. CC-CFT742]